MKRVVIVGGGIAGLTVAYRLESAPVEVTLLESRPRLGGVIETRRRDGFVVEGGPDSFVTMKPWAIELCRELGLESRLLPVRSRRFFVFSKGRLHEFPPGVFLTVPTRILPFARNRLVSLPGKIRMLMDLVLPRGPRRDESIGSFVRRRLGREALEKIAEPIMAGIYVAPADRLSLRTTFPRFADLEASHRSLLLALRNHRAEGSTSPFLTLRSGMTELVDALAARLKRTNVILGTKVERIEPGFRVHAGGRFFEADRLVLATPAPDTADLVHPFAPDLARAVAAIPTSSTATVSLAYRSGDLPAPLDGTGFVLPRRERRGILACTWSSGKFEGRAPDGHVLLRCFLGGAGEETVETEDESSLIATSRAELARVMNLRAEPVFHSVSRWPKANPVYEVGHTERVSAIERLRPPGLHLTGCAYRGIGLPDGIRDATETAAAVLRNLHG